MIATKPIRNKFVAALLLLACASTSLDMRGAENAAENTAPRAKAGDMYLKTNTVGWGLLMVNIAPEVDLGAHWSAQLPVYCSGWDYGHSNRKFRTFALIPEGRWWQNPANEGFFVGAHFGLAYYNIALGRSERWQDRGGHTPALGGGLSLGYRCDLTGNGRWGFEFAVGAGVYNLDYDIFQNRGNGLLTGTKHKTAFILDTASLSLVYRFGKRK